MNKRYTQVLWFLAKPNNALTALPGKPQLSVSRKICSKTKIRYDNPLDFNRVLYRSYASLRYTSCIHGAK